MYERVSGSLESVEQDPDPSEGILPRVAVYGTGGHQSGPGVRYSMDAYRAHKRRQLRTSVLLFIATFLSTFLVGSAFIPLELAITAFVPGGRESLDARLQEHAAVTGQPPETFEGLLWEYSINGLKYAVPLMIILLCHEMGHFLQSVRYRVPASFPYFIPLPVPPLGTMGAVILQGRGVADRRQMFDIAVSGPIAGLIVTLPVLYYGILTSEFSAGTITPTEMEFGEPLLLKWMIRWLHGPTPEGAVFVLNGYGFAGWVGVFITAMNLLPVGQLDGGHILYTLIGRPAHWVAMGIIAVGCAVMVKTGTYSYLILVLLLTLTGVKHPPTSSDHIPLGVVRHLLGWATLSFLIIGFTPQPIIIQQNSGPELEQTPERTPEDVDPDQLVQVNTRTVDAKRLEKVFSVVERNTDYQFTNAARSMRVPSEACRCRMTPPVETGIQNATTGG